MPTSDKEQTQLTWVETLMRWCGAGVDIEDIKNAAACGAQVVQCNLDFWAWKTPLSDKGGVLGGDPFADFVKVCQQYTVKPLAYVGGFTKPADPDFIKQHEDWLRIDAEGKRSTQGWMCYNTSFGDFLIQRCAELVKRYELVGLWIDGYNPLFTPCYCPHCKAAYAKASGGAEIPKKFDPADMNAVRYVRWHIENLNDFSSRLCKAVREARPGAVVLANFSAAREWARKTPWPLWDTTTGLRRVHAPSLELWWENPGDAVHQSFAIQSLRAGAGEGPTEVWMVTRPRGVDSTALTCVELLCRMFSVIANGSWPDIVADPGDHARSRLCFDEMRPRVPWMIGTKWHKWGAMLVSEKTRMTYGYEDPRRYMDCLHGAFRAYTEEHLPVRMIMDEDIEEGDLSAYDVLFLPNAACLSDKAIAKIKEYVRNGGGLVASLETALYDDWGKKRPDFGLAELFKASYVELQDHSKRDNAERIRFEEKHPITDDQIIRNDRWFIAVSSPQNARGSVDFIGYSTDVKLHDGSEVVAKKFNPGPIANTKEWPSVVVSTYGKGRVVYLASGLDGSYYNFGNPYQRRVIRNALLWAARAKPKVEVEAPMAVQATFYEQENSKGKRLIVHLLNDHSSWGRHSLYQQTWPTREEVLPIYDIKVNLPGFKVKSARLEPGGKSLKLQRNGQTTQVVVPKLDIHAMVVAEME